MSNLANAFLFDHNDKVELGNYVNNLLNSIKGPNSKYFNKYQNMIPNFNKIFKGVDSTKKINFNSVRIFTISFKRDVKPVVLRKFMKHSLIAIQNGESASMHEIEDSDRDIELNELSKQFLANPNKKSKDALLEIARKNKNIGLWYFIENFYDNFFGIDNLISQYFPDKFETPIPSTITLLTVHHDDVPQLLETDLSKSKIEDDIIHENLKDDIINLCDPKCIYDSSYDDQEITPNDIKSIKKEILSINKNIEKETANLNDLKKENEQKSLSIKEIQKHLQELKSVWNENAQLIANYQNQCNFLIESLYVLRQNSALNNLEKFTIDCKCDNDDIVDQFMDNLKI
ncbi:hypothetical protein M9Y10_005865 [Tritrichomonas musculus]|uniref:Uncharacterized protein n=1 Tax=Tritrichomonas musculus TaxID=1915356 RepID=A0ABR2JCQ9_9EUKA